MKRGHRRWHRWVWLLLAPLLTLLLLSAGWGVDPPPAEAALPPALANALVEDR